MKKRETVKNDKLKSMIKAVLMALITVAGFVGLGEYVPLLKMIVGELDLVWEAVVKIIEIVTFIFVWKPETDKNVAGGILKGKLNKSMLKSHIDDEALFEAARAA